jgi:hypothetical protein
MCSLYLEKSVNGDYPQVFALDSGRSFDRIVMKMVAADPSLSGHEDYDLLIFHQRFASIHLP